MPFEFTLAGDDLQCLVRHCRRFPLPLPVVLHTYAKRGRAGAGRGGTRVRRCTLRGAPTSHQRSGDALTHKTARVALGDCSPKAPTDPDVRDYRFRLFATWIRYAMSL